MNVDLSVIQQSGGSGLRQTNQWAFTQPFAQMAQTGRNLQWLGATGVELVSRQKSLADDLAYGELLADFKNAQRENEGKLIQFSKRDPSALAPDKHGDYPLAANAFALGVNSQKKILDSSKFKSLGVNAQRKLTQLTNDLINEREIKAKLDTTKILHAAQIVKDEQNFSAVLNQGNDPNVSEIEFQAQVDTYKAELIKDSQRNGIRDSLQLQKTLESIDKRVTKVKYNKAKLMAVIEGTPKAIQSVADRLQKGEFGTKPENVATELTALYGYFNTAQEAQARRWKEAKTQVVNETETEFLQRLDSGDFEENELEDMLDEYGDNELRGEGTKLRQLRKDLKAHFKPESDPPSSINREMLLSVERVDILNPDASGDLNDLLRITQNLGESEEGLSAKEEAGITQAINKKLLSINKADATKAAAEKTKYIKRIEHRMREGRDRTMPMSSNAMAIQFVAEDLFNELILKSQMPGEEPLTYKEAWETVDDAITQVRPPLQELALDLDALQQALEIDASELRARFARGEDITDREEEALRIYTDALEANQSSLLNKNQSENTGQ